MDYEYNISKTKLKENFMETFKKLEEKQLNSIVLDGEEMTETSTEAVISESSEHQRKIFHEELDNRRIQCRHAREKSQ